MTIEDYAKLQLVAHQISLKDAAFVLGYETQSLRNKLTRHSFNLHDIFMLSLILENKLMLVDGNNNPVYTFETDDYLSTEDAKRLTKYRDDRSTKISFSSWFNTLSPQKRDIIFRGVQRSREEAQRTFLEKHNVGTAHVKSTNFTHVIEICGRDCDTAAKWLSEKIKDVTPEDEIIFCVASEKMFDIYINYSAPNTLAIKNESDNISYNIKNV